jgi:ABC-type phosphate transport system substrate-binding protein
MRGDALVKVKKRLAALIALVSVGLVAGAFGALPASADPPVMNPSHGVSFVRGAGSDTTFEVMNDLAAHYNGARGCIAAQSGQTFPLNGTCVDFDPGTAGIQPQYESGINNANPDHDIVWGFYPVGSGNGITLLTQTGNPGVIPRLSYARSSRAEAPADPAGLRFLAFARDAIPWVKFNDSAVANEASDPVSNLSVAQLTSIFVSCGTTNWNQVGGNAGTIAVWAAQNGSGTRVTYDGFVGGNSTNCIPPAQKDGNLVNGERVIFENEATPIFNASANDCTPLAAPCSGNSIFYYSLGRFNANPPVQGTRSGVLGNINGIVPNEANVVDGTYPFSRDVFNVIRNAFGSGNANQSVRDFFDGDGWMCASDLPNNPLTNNTPYRTEIQNIIRAEGFFPFPEAPQGEGGFPNGHCRINDST